MFKKVMPVVAAFIALFGFAVTAEAIQNVPYNQTVPVYGGAEEHQTCEYYHWRWPKCEEVIVSPKALVGVNFDFDKATLRPESYAILDGNVEKMRGNSKRVTVTGHTDWIGSDAYNDGLSMRRATTVYNYFVSKGISASRLTKVGQGESQPTASNDSEEGRFKNRRVELKWD